MSPGLLPIPSSPICRARLLPIPSGMRAYSPESWPVVLPGPVSAATSYKSPLFNTSCILMFSSLSLMMPISIECLIILSRLVSILFVVFTLIILSCSNSPNCLYTLNFGQFGEKSVFIDTFTNCRFWPVRTVHFPRTVDFGEFVKVQYLSILLRTVHFYSVYREFTLFMTHPPDIDDFAYLMNPPSLRLALASFISQLLYPIT